MFWASLLYTRTRSSLETRYGFNVDEGRVRSTRWEWGFGKGRWKRQAKKAAQVFDMKGRTRAFYFLVGSCYRLDYVGTKASAQLLYEEIR